MGYDDSELFAKWDKKWSKERKANGQSRLTDFINAKTGAVLSIIIAIPLVMYFIT